MRLATVAALLLGGVPVKLFFFPGPKLLVTGQGSALAPKWSPTGRQLAYLMIEGEQARLGVHDLRTASQRTLAEVRGMDASAFAWSPDGRRIAYAGPGEREWEEVVSVVDVESGQTRSLAPGHGPVWAPDGSSLLMWCAGEAGGPEDVGAEEGEEIQRAPVRMPGLCRVSLDGTELRRSPGEEDGGWLGWGAAVSAALGKIAFERFAEPAESAPPARTSVDGEFIEMVDSVAARGARNVAEGSRDLARELEARQYAKRRAGATVKDGSTPRSDIFLVDFEGGPARRLTNDGHSGSPTWTPDGARILYWSQGELLLMNPDGGGRQSVFAGSPKPANASPAQLTADGRYVVFVAPVPGNPGVAELMTGESPADLHWARVGSAKARRLANRHSFKQRFALSPDGKRIVYEVLAEAGGLLSRHGRSELWMMRF